MSKQPGNASSIRSNIFVIGDLVVDHTVFVNPDEKSRHSPLPGESVYEVIHRQDAAGGAANTARILAVLNQDVTCLWGIVGACHWGAFREILEHCHRLDGATHNVEFRGIQDETQAMMNTITRLVLVTHPTPNSERLDHKARFDDYGHVHVPESKRESVVYYLKRASSPERLGGIDAIILNDLDMGCLTEETIKQIALFANANQIPLFIDPKRKNKFSTIEATAILPNLNEWCHLTNQVDREEYWRQTIRTHHGLGDMTRLSLRYLGNFKYHVIKCDVNGAVLIIPSPGKEQTSYTAYHVAPHPTQSESRSQLGCGDVMSGVFAMEYACDKTKTSDSILKSFLRANATVAAYREMSWQRMPPKSRVIEIQSTIDRGNPILLEMATPNGVVFLPNQPTIRLHEFNTAVDGVYTCYPQFSATIARLWNDLTQDCNAPSKSIVLGGPSGCGKTNILRALSKRLRVRDVKFDKAGGVGLLLKEWNDEGRGRPSLVVIDEAYKDYNRTVLTKEFGPQTLDYAHGMGVRFLFVDALFSEGIPRDFKPTKYRREEFVRRVSIYQLSSLAARPRDISLTAGQLLLRWCAKHGIEENVTVDWVVLAWIIDKVLENPEPTFAHVSPLVEQVLDLAQTDNSWKASRKILPKHIPGKPARSDISDLGEFVFEA